MSVIPDASICPVCDCHKARNWKLCKDCGEIYGLIASEWPIWVRFKVNDNQRWRYELALFDEYETGLEADYEAGRLIGVPDEPLLTRDESETALAGKDYLPYAPYNSEVENKQYRAANGIAEREPTCASSPV